jgi:Uma2 family endonuclease
METLIHNQIKAIISMVVSSIVFSESLGRYLADRMMLTHEGAGLSCEPDGMYVSNERFGNGLVTLEQGDQSLEIIGGADMVLEVISKTSVEKDIVTLKDLYAKAGITEYWLVDSTDETPELSIMRLASGKYTTARKQDGWVKSKVFGRSFRLTCKKDAKGLSHFNLETN